MVKCVIMKNNWYASADPHLNHSNIIKYCKRPFLSLEEKNLLELVERGIIPERELRISQESTNLMTNTIIDNINKVVNPNDTFVILGDFCWTSKFNREEDIKNLRNRILCKNVFLILGNHDDKRVYRNLAGYFSGIYDQFVFNVNSKNIFTSHYPARSWDKANHGSYCLYGHCHSNLSPEDNGELLYYDKKVYTDGFTDVLKKYGIENGSIVEDLMQVAASVKGIDLTLDVGVDNTIRGEEIPFGTPWSFEEIVSYMDKKIDKWNLRKSFLE